MTKSAHADICVAALTAYYDGVPKAEIARRLLMHKDTVSNIVRRWEADGLIQALGSTFCTETAALTTI